MKRNNPITMLAAWLALAFMPIHSAQAANENVAQIQLPPKENFHLFLLVGQSNMAGRGVIEAEDRVAHPRVLMLDPAGSWVPAVDPIHFDKGPSGVGLGRTFGLEIAAANPGITVGLIPCAAGGSLIESWSPGVYYPSTKSYPWDNALRRVRAAQEVGTLKGILWHQGESDSYPGRAEKYEGKLHDLIARFRHEVGMPNVPFIAGQMGHFYGRPWDDAKRQVDAAHRDLPDKVERTAFVYAVELHHKGDRMHFDTASYRELGRRYAAAYLRLVSTH